MGRRIVARMALFMAITALVACSADDQAHSGKAVSITFKERTMLGYLFVLENPTSQAIYFRGTTWLWLGPNPADSAFNCHTKDMRKAMIGGYPIYEGKDPPPIKVPPGKAMKLWVQAGALKDNMDEDCQLRIMLWHPGMASPRGEEIESPSFKS